MLMVEAIVMAILLVWFLADSGIAEMLSSLTRMLTEGNTFGKHVILLSFLIFTAISRALVEKAPRKFLEGINLAKVMKALIIVVAFGYAFNLAANLLLMNSYGAPINGYVAHVTDCGNATCWEATYIQHSHALKPAIYFADKLLGLNLNANVDTGKPMYEIERNADAIAIITLATLFLIFAFSYILLLKEKKFGAFVLLQLAAITAIITVLDGGAFTVAGINAVVLLALYYFHEKPFSKSALFYLGLIAYVFAIGEIVPKIVGSNLVFYEYFAPALLFIGIYAFGKAKGIKTKAVYFAIILFAMLHFINFFNFNYKYDMVSPENRMIVYGLPDGEKTDNALKSFDSPKISSFSRYGWFAVISLKEKAFVKEVVLKLREKLSPKGYFLGESDFEKPRKEKITVELRDGKGLVEISTYSFKPDESGICNGRCEIEGTAGLHATHIALEIGSYLHSIGRDAVVVTPVMWNYG